MRVAMFLVLGTFPWVGLAAPVDGVTTTVPISTLPSIEVIGTSAAEVEGHGVDARRIPNPVQVIGRDQLDASPTISLADHLNRYSAGFTVNEAQGNPLQPDVQFRGFTASPLLGLPQGLSVYVNGVRFNEIFGDTVNFDLLADDAIESATVHPGSNPVFGLNSLGGALALRTKTGFSAPGHSVEIAGGSFGRNWQSLQSGGNKGRFGYYVNVRRFADDGFRDFSASEVAQGLGAFSYRNDRGQLNLTLAGTDNDLIGNGPIPVELAAQDRSAIFTRPDLTSNRLFFSALDGNWQVAEQLELSGNVYYRQNLVATLNGDQSEFAACEQAGNAGLLCEEAGEDDEEPVLDVNGQLVAATPAVAGGALNRNQIHQRGYGISLQSAFTRPLWGRDNRLLIGVSYDHGQVRYSADSELGRLDETRQAIGGGVLTDAARVRLNTQNNYIGVFISDNLALTDRLALTLSGRYNFADIRLLDQAGDALNGAHEFSRFNPAVGMTYALTDKVTTYVSYGESTRAPTPVELSCADPEAPCRLPNAFLSDPPLEQVVARTVEGGLRGEGHRYVGGSWKWHAGFFRTENDNDILFITTGALGNQGFFRNVGQTLREGIQLDLSGGFDRGRVGLSYDYLSPTFETAFLASSPNNPQADANGQVSVQPGNRIPGLPQHVVKLTGELDVARQVTVGADLIYNSERFLRGDESNTNRQLEGYAVVNLHGEYRVHRRITLFGRIENLFDTSYSTFGLFGEPAEVLGATFTNQRFITPAAGRAGWVGIRVALD